MTVDPRCEMIRIVVFVKAFIRRAVCHKIAVLGKKPFEWNALIKEYVGNALIQSFGRSKVSTKVPGGGSKE